MDAIVTVHVEKIKAPVFFCLSFYLLSSISMGTALGKVAPADGLKIYSKYCAVCHGEKGNGLGKASVSLVTKPTDFTSANYKYRSTRWGSSPLDSDMERTIHDGLNGTAMPGWGDLLSADKIRSLILVLRGFSPATFEVQPIPIQLPNQKLLSVENESSAVIMGKMLYTQYGCGQCHGVQGRGDGPLAGQIKDAKGNFIRPRNLMDHRNYRLGATIQDIYLRVSTGLNGTPMEGYADRMTPREIINLSFYLRWLYNEAEKSRWSEMETHHDAVHRGEYLVSIMGCQLCHTPINADGSYQAELRLAGGQRIYSFPDGIYYARNLRPDPESGLGNWSISDIKSAITRGTSKNGRLLYPFDMPWLFFSNLKDSDAEDIAVYLKSLDPIYNNVPEPRQTGFWKSAWNKLLFFFGRDRILEYGFVNLGEINHEKGHQRLGSAKGYWSILPPFGRWLPFKGMKKIARPEFPLPKNTNSASENAKLLRGRYLVSIVPCGLCHASVKGNFFPKVSDTLWGGTKISWGGEYGFGTLYSKNLTSDRETGLGNWTDFQIKRAIKSGVAKDGRMMHWQAMPWDLFANFTEADLEAVIAYLRSLPPVRRTYPSPTPDASPVWRINVGRDYGAS